MSKTNISHQGAETKARPIRPKASEVHTTSTSSSTEEDGGMDWAAFEAMTEEQVIAAALSDPDAQPWTAEQLAKAKRRPRCFTIRRALRMTQEQFAEAFRIPVGTIRDWEQWRTEPDQAAKAYMKVIAVDPQYVMAALAHVPGTPKPKAD